MQDKLICDFIYKAFVYMLENGYNRSQINNELVKICLQHVNINGYRLKKILKYPRYDKLYKLTFVYRKMLKEKTILDDMINNGNQRNRVSNY